MALSYALTTPCKDCPFRTDVRPYLTAARASEIVDSLVPSRLGGGSTFTCHKTTVPSDDEDSMERVDGPNAQHCAGALIMLEKAELLDHNQMARISMRLGLLNPDKLNMDAPVFEHPDDFVDAQKD